MKSWKFFNPVDIHFGIGVLQKLFDFVGSDRIVLISSPGSSERGTTGYLKNRLNIPQRCIFDRVIPNPTLYSIKEAFFSLQSIEYDSIVALGGGSVLDTAKAISVLSATLHRDLEEEQLKQALLLSGSSGSKPIIAIPTTAGTGSEVTQWGTFWDKKEKRKYSFSHHKLYPQLALLDPELTVTLPEKETLSCALDSLSHALEAIWNTNHNPVSDLFASQAIKLIYNYLPELKNNLTNKILRTHMLKASLCAGLAFSNTKTALAHAISYPLTAHFNIPHGIACGISLPHLLEISGKRNFERVKIIASSLGAKENIHIMTAKLGQFFNEIGVSLQLSSYGITKVFAQKLIQDIESSERKQNFISTMTHGDIIYLVDRLLAN